MRYKLQKLRFFCMPWSYFHVDIFNGIIDVFFAKTMRSWIILINVIELIKSPTQKSHVAQQSVTILGLYNCAKLT